MSRRKSNKKVKQMICDQLPDIDGSAVVRAWFENGELVAWFDIHALGYKTKAFLVHGCKVSLTANQMKGK